MTSKLWRNRAEASGSQEAPYDGLHPFVIPGDAVQSLKSLGI